MSTNRCDRVARIIARDVALGNVRKNRCTVAAIVAKSKIEFYFSQRLRQRKKKVREMSVAGWTIFRASCAATKLRDKLHETLAIVKADLHGTIFAYDCRMRFL